MAELFNFRATKGTSLFTVVTGGIRSEWKCEKHNQRRRGCCAPEDTKNYVFIPEITWLSWGVRTVHQAMQKPFCASTWGRRGGTDGHWAVGLNLHRTAWLLSASTMVQDSANPYFWTLVGECRVNTSSSDV